MKILQKVKFKPCEVSFMSHLNDSSLLNHFLHMLQIDALIRQKGWELSWSRHLGYITACPSNLGTGLRASVHLSIPHLAKVRILFTRLTDKNQSAVQFKYKCLNYICLFSNEVLASLTASECKTKFDYSR